MMEFSQITADLVGYSENSPWLLFLLIIGATFILEDAATIGAALLAADGVISAELAISALFIGIAIGDLGLYGLGRYAATHPKARAWIEGKRGQNIADWAQSRTWSMVFASRFVPGMRLPTYVGAGFLKAPFIQFTLAVLAATALWTVVLFSIVFFLGEHVLNELGPWKWAVGAALIALIFFIERHMASKAKRTSP